jgi:hypothetical protein
MRRGTRLGRPPGGSGQPPTHKLRPSRELHELRPLYRSPALKCDSSGRLLPGAWSRRASRNAGGQSRGSDNSSSCSGRARVAPAGELDRRRSPSPAPALRSVVGQPPQARASSAGVLRSRCGTDWGQW